ncbi:multidrug ABC transporter permease [Caldanaerobacter subterraneus subsp. yonseiensis KB-1]|uniref:Multidrug ABC transporter permease n=1 Tax=Caldanaerobacter subterraneus subsp. yonseiensis KB-1 TaxID=1388761 RepID=U5CTA5_CALSX|nr:ABC transporter permease [Caldanaerobacter subterraneus]ERM92186.1 multidrug ABC transporter permease [Caldanaerobacter subterraneus subsp. yonseiensis KB-1]
MNKIVTGIQMELKSLRMYKWQVVSSLLILPLSYVFVLLLFGGVRGEIVAYLVSGYMVATFIGAFLGLYAIRICNLMEPRVLELYSTMSVNIKEIAFSLALTYIIFTLPVVIISSYISVIFARGINVSFLIVGIMASLVTILLIGTFLGLLIRNIFIAQGIIPLLSWVFLLFAPVYYSVEQLNPIYRGILMINPVTHCLNLIRLGLGFESITNVTGSLVYLIILIVIFGAYSLKAFNRVYILERFY